MSSQYPYPLKIFLLLLRRRCWYRRNFCFHRSPAERLPRSKIQDMTVVLKKELRSLQYRFKQPRKSHVDDFFGAVFLFGWRISVKRCNISVKISLYRSNLNLRQYNCPIHKSTGNDIGWVDLHFFHENVACSTDKEGLPKSNPFIG